MSGIMGEGGGVISRRRERIAGMRGPGRVRRLMNPLVGTRPASGERDAAQAEARPGPSLRAMQGKAP